MRLGQIARKLEIDSEKIVKFLSEKGVEIENHPNAKLDDESLELIEKNFNTQEPEGPKNSTNLEVEAAIEEVISEDIEVAETVSILPSSVESPIKEETVIEEKISIEPLPIVSNTVETEELKVITLPKEEVEKMVENGEILSEIEAEAAKLSEAGIIKAKLKKLDGLSVKGKIELPSDPKREQKDLQRKQKEEEKIKIKNAGKTIDGVHPTKRAKEEGEKVKSLLIEQEQKAKERADREQLRLEKEAEKNKLQDAKSLKKKKASKHKVEVVKTLSPEELKKKKNREKRHRQKENQSKQPESKGFWQSFKDFFGIK